MKPFSKRQAIGEGKPVVTRDGSKVLHLHEFPVNAVYTVFGLIEGQSEISAWTSDGNYHVTNRESSNDLFMASTKYEGWIAFGKHYQQQGTGLRAFVTHAFPTEDQAKASFKSSTGLVASGTQSITWEE